MTTALLPNFFAGRWQTGIGAGTPLFDPVLGTELARVSSAGIDLAEGFAFAREQGGAALRALSYGQRAALLGKIVEVLQAHRDAYYEIATANSGTVAKDSGVDIDGAIFTLGYYAKQGAALGDATLLLDGERIRMAKDPAFQTQHIQVPTQGVALFINAFNFPSWGLWEKAAPALLSGVPVIVKPCNLGSSAGVSTAADGDELIAGVLKVFEYDVEALIEPFITNRLEINVAVAGLDEPVASVTEMPVTSQASPLSFSEKYKKQGRKSVGTSEGMASALRVLDPDDLPLELLPADAVQALGRDLEHRRVHAVARRHRGALRRRPAPRAPPGPRAPLPGGAPPLGPESLVPAVEDRPPAVLARALDDPTDAVAVVGALDLRAGAGDLGLGDRLRGATGAGALTHLRPRARRPGSGAASAA